MFAGRPKKFSVLGLFFLFIIACSGCGTISQNNPQISGKVRGDYLGCAMGAYVSGEETESSFSSNIDAYETLIEKQLAVVMWYIDFGTPFPESYCNQVYSRGAIPMVTLELFRPEPFTLEAIASGEYDAALNAFATAAKKWGQRMFLRPLHEMNGDWYPWSGAGNGADALAAQKYIDAWKRIYGVFSDAGAGNVTFVWSPNARSVPSAGWNDIVSYYPGTDYVDWVGLDGYSFSGTSGQPTYETFSAIFKTAYVSLEALGKPIMVTESACAEGPQKSVWIDGAFGNLSDQTGSGLGKFKVFVWFNRLKEQDWRVNSSTSPLNSFKNDAADPYFLESIP